ncbi:MAG: hypothetical protein ABIF09_08760 [Gemmatimonadota bacterium]
MGCRRAERSAVDEGTLLRVDGMTRCLVGAARAEYVDFNGVRTLPNSDVIVVGEKGVIFRRVR